MVGYRKIKDFIDLEAWKESHLLTLLVYECTQRFPKSELYGITSQLRRAVISIESCIAEGFCRFHYRERLQFYYDARGSVGEVKSQLITAKDLGFLLPRDFEKLYNQAEKAGVILAGLIRSTEKLSGK